MVEEVKEVKKSSKVSTIIICLLLLVIVGLCGYIYMNKDKLSISADAVKTNEKAEKETEEAKKDETKDEAQENSACQVVGLDLSKSLNSSIKNYSLSSVGTVNVNAKIDSTQKVLTFGFNPDSVVSTYGLSWKSTKPEGSVYSSKINFDKKIVDLFFGSMGQDVMGDTLFILMEDGTVEYIPLVHMFNHAQDGPISYGKIAGVSNVNHFASADMGYGLTTLAVRNDGSFYDLWYAVKDTGNY